MWGDMFSTISCGLVLLWGKEDPWSSITLGALTRAVLAAHSATGHGWLSNDGGASRWPSSRVLASFKLTTRPSSSARHPHSWRSSASCPECTLATGYPSYQQHHGESDHLSLPPWEHLFCSLPDYLPQREGWLPGGPGVL